MKLTTYNAILLAVILTGTFLLGIVAIISFVWLSIQDMSPQNVVVAAPKTAQSAEAPHIHLNLVVEGSKKYRGHTFVIGPRIYMEQGNDSYKNGSLSSFGYQRASKRNIGHVALDTLESQWYFGTNDQNILNIDDVFTGKNDNTKWHGTFVEVVNSDTNADGVLSKEDLSQLYWIDESFKPKLILADVQSVNRLANYEKDSILNYRRDGTDFMSKFDLETNEITQAKMLQPQK